MRALFSIALLTLLATPAFAVPIDVPEPETLSLLALSLVGLLVARRRSK